MRMIPHFIVYARRTHDVDIPQRVVLLMLCEVGPPLLEGDFCTTSVALIFYLFTLEMSSFKVCYLSSKTRLLSSQMCGLPVKCIAQPIYLVTLPPVYLRKSYKLLC